MASLTELERTILDLVAEGLTNRQIAVKVSRAEKTVQELHVVDPDSCDAKPDGPRQPSLRFDPDRAD